MLFEESEARYLKTKGHWSSLKESIHNRLTEMIVHISSQVWIHDTCWYPEFCIYQTELFCFLSFWSSRLLNIYQPTRGLENCFKKKTQSRCFYNPWIFVHFKWTIQPNYFQTFIVSAIYLSETSHINIYNFLTMIHILNRKNKRIIKTIMQDFFSKTL